MCHRVSKTSNVGNLERMRRVDSFAWGEVGISSRFSIFRFQLLINRQTTHTALSQATGKFVCNDFQIVVHRRHHAHGFRKELLLVVKHNAAPRLSEMSHLGHWSWKVRPSHVSSQNVNKRHAKRSLLGQYDNMTAPFVRKYSRCWIWDPYNYPSDPFSMFMAVWHSVRLHIALLSSETKAERVQVPSEEHQDNIDRTTDLICTNMHKYICDITHESYSGENNRNQVVLLFYAFGLGKWYQISGGTQLSRWPKKCSNHESSREGSGPTLAHLSRRAGDDARRAAYMESWVRMIVQ